jgi:SAM-dependent methyltransferase
VTEPLFDLSLEYEAMLNRGISLSGERKEFFIEGRIRSLVEHLPHGFCPRRVLDYGCGIGASSPCLAGVFQCATVTGVDTSASALEYAEKHHSSSRIRFRTTEALAEEEPFDLCYVNGVFHHIAPGQRESALAAIRAALHSNAYLAFFENNPWNPGTRMVMARIPFDRGAETISQPSARRLLSKAGFDPHQAWSLFYFPRALRVLRPLEAWLTRLPLGAQYCVLAAKRPL